MKEYITISRTEKDMAVLTIFILIGLLMTLCFKGMKVEKDYMELLEEKEALEEIIEVED